MQHKQQGVSVGTETVHTTTPDDSTLHNLSMTTSASRARAAVACTSMCKRLLSVATRTLLLCPCACLPASVHMLLQRHTAHTLRTKLSNMKSYRSLPCSQGFGPSSTLHTGHTLALPPTRMQLSMQS